jgi:hypothetical protein
MRDGTGGFLIALLAIGGCAEAVEQQQGGVTVGSPAPAAAAGFSGNMGASGMFASAGTGVPTAGTGVPTAGTGVPTAGTGVPTAGTGAPIAGTGVPSAGTGVPTAGVSGAAGVSGGAGIGEPMAGTGGEAGQPAAGTGGTPPQPGSKTPVVPALTATCPQFRNSTITFMGLGGIQVVAGTKAASASAPMVFYWHGTGSVAGEFASMAGAVRDGVVREGGVLISFQGTTGGDLLSGTLIFGAGDFNLTDQLFACAVKDHNVDARRVFTTGCSAGGLFAGAMAARRSTYIAASAPNSGGWTVPVMFQNDFTPPLMTIHGAAGRDVVFVDFSNTSRTADMAFKARGGFVINCDHGGGHCGGAPLAPSIWEFFKAHPYGVTPAPWTGGLPAGFHRSCQLF